jgi:hypothetical protein
MALSFANIGKFFKAAGHDVVNIATDAGKVINIAGANSTLLAAIPGVGPEVAGALNLITGVESLFPTAGGGTAKKSLVVAGVTAAVPTADQPTLSAGIDAAVKAMSAFMDAVVMIEAALKKPA